MLYLFALLSAILVWPRYFLFFLTAPPAGAAVGGILWLVASLLTGFSLPPLALGAAVGGGMVLFLLLTVVWVSRDADASGRGDRV